MDKRNRRGRQSFNPVPRDQREALHRDPQRNHADDRGGQRAGDVQPVAGIGVSAMVAPA